MIVTTMNSKYEIDFAEGRFRRIEGKNEAILEIHGNKVPDGTWVGYAEAKKINSKYGDVWYFVLNDGGYLRTSLVQEETE